MHRLSSFATFRRNFSRSPSAQVTRHPDRPKTEVLRGHARKVIWIDGLTAKCATFRNVCRTSRLTIFRGLLFASYFPEVACPL
jgi:hypothetical protein